MLNTEELADLIKAEELADLIVNTVKIAIAPLNARIMALEQRFTRLDAIERRLGAIERDAVVEDIVKEAEAVAQR